MSSKSVERLCGKDGHWGPGLPRCKGADDDDCEPDDIDDDDNDDDDNDDDDGKRQASKQDGMRCLRGP